MYKVPENSQKTTIWALWQTTNRNKIVTSYKFQILFFFLFLKPIGQIVFLGSVPLQVLRSGMLFFHRLCWLLSSHWHSKMLPLTSCADTPTIHTPTSLFCLSNGSLCLWVWYVLSPEGNPWGHSSLSVEWWLAQVCIQQLLTKWMDDWLCAFPIPSTKSE